MMNRNEVMLPHNAEAPPLKRGTPTKKRHPGSSQGASRRSPPRSPLYGVLRWDVERGEPQPLRNSYDNPASQQMLLVMLPHGPLPYNVTVRITC